MNFLAVAIADLEPLARAGMYTFRGLVYRVENTGKVSLISGGAK